MTARIAIGALLFEGNTLSPVITTLDAFKNNYLERGPQLVERLKDSTTEMAGAIAVLEQTDTQIVPLIASHGGAGGRVSKAALETLRDELLKSLRDAGEVDAVYLALHGAFIAQGVDDMEGELLTDVRNIVGDKPIGVSCDLHAHITPAMVQQANFIIGYRHYPHDDTYDTGRRCAGLLLQTLKGQINPVMQVRQAPMIVPAQKQRTKSDGPMGKLHARARAWEAAGEVIAVSYFPVQPWLDFAHVGFASVAIADGNASAADAVALDICREAWCLRDEFNVELTSVGDAIKSGLAIDGAPIVLADAADCVGGGAGGDSAVVLNTLLTDAPTSPATMIIADPQTVVQAVDAGIGATIQASLGNKMDVVHGAPVTCDARVTNIVDGTFTYSGGLLGGITATMGQSVVLQINQVELLVASHACYEYADEQFRAAGIDPFEKKFIVVKNPMNYQQAFANAAASYVLDTSGPTTANLKRVAWQQISRPRFPLDDDFIDEHTFGFIKVE